MAQQTTLTPAGVPGRLYSFAAKALAVLLQRYSLTVDPHGRGRLYLVTFRADEAGDAVVAFDGRDEALIRGVISRIETAPNLQNPPDANWDVTLEDEWGRDVLGGAGLNRSNSAAEPAFPYHALGTSGQAERMVGRPLWLRVANAGNAKPGEIALLVVAPQVGR